MIESPWDRRIERAEELAANHPTAAEILRFYSQLARLQKSIYDELRQTRTQSPDVSCLLPRFTALLALVKRIGPAPLAESAIQLTQNTTEWQTLLFEQHAEPEKAFFARVLLQPYFEYRGGQSTVAAPAMSPTCPFCGERPQVAVLRGEGDGGKRSLMCSLCLTGWEFRRLLCPNCAEESEHNLPVYVAEEFPHIRVEACDTCHTYLKCIDLTKNGLAVPVVDELAAVSLTIWAEEHGYAKLQMNLLGM